VEIKLLQGGFLRRIAMNLAALAVWVAAMGLYAQGPAAADQVQPSHPNPSPLGNLLAPRPHARPAQANAPQTP